MRSYGFVYTAVRIVGVNVVHTHQSQYKSRTRGCESQLHRQKLRHCEAYYKVLRYTQPLLIATNSLSQIKSILEYNIVYNVCVV